MVAGSWLRWFALGLALALASGCTIKSDDDDDEDRRSEETASQDGGESDAGDGDADSAGDTGDDAGDAAMVGSDAGADDGLSDSDGGDVDETDVDLSPATSSTPLYATADCGSIEPTDVPASADRGSPTVFEIGQVVGGRIDPDSTANQEHYWEVELSAGFYHLVLDTETADGRDTNIGLGIDRLDENGVDIGRLLSGNEIARRYRDAHFFEVETDAVWQFRVTPRFNMEDYFLAVFQNGTSVPSPQFVDCPTLTPLTLGEPASFALGEEASAEEAKWFTIDLEIGDYTFRVETVQADGVSTNLQYVLEVIDRFGQEPRAERVVRANEIDTSFAAEGTLVVGEAGPRYVRMLNGNNELDVTLTVLEQ